MRPSRQVLYRATASANDRRSTARQPHEEVCALLPDSRPRQETHQAGDMKVAERGRRHLALLWRRKLGYPRIGNAVGAVDGVLVVGAAEGRPDVLPDDRALLRHLEHA